MDITNIEQELHLKDYVDVLRRRRSVVVIFFVTIVFVVTIGSLIMRPVYQASATLLIDAESPNVLTTSGLVSLESQNYYSYKEYYQSQKEIITSRAIARRIFNEFNLGNTKKYAKAKDPIKAFLKTVNVAPVRDTRLLRLNVENRDPVLAAKIANRMAEVYVERNLYYISRDELMNLLKNEYLKLESRLSEYTRIYKSKHPKIIRLKEEISELVKKIESVKKSAFHYDVVPQDLKEGGMYTLEGLKANNVSIEDPAEVPAIPIRPKKRLNVLLAIIVGFFGGVALAFFFEYLDDTVKSLEDVEKLVKWPFLGCVPIIDLKNSTTEFEKDLLTHLKPKDPTAEAYRAIRTSVFFSSTEERPLRSMLVTSPGPKEGKTTTVCNLGIVIGQFDRKVLIVDADMRMPRLHEVFKKKNEKGLSDFLCGQAKLEDIVQKTDIENIFIISGGSYPPNPSELLSSHKMKQFIEAAKKKYDFILFDTPPAAVVTDAVVLSKAADGVIMVVESGKTSRRALPRVSKVLDDAKARIVGTLLNKVPIKSSSYHYYYYTQYYGKTR